MNLTPRLTHAATSLRQHAAAMVLMTTFALGLGTTAALAAARATAEPPPPPGHTEMIR